MIVLDEPTAAIDPIEETKIYKKFKEISDERTTVLVTHRLPVISLTRVDFPAPLCPTIATVSPLFIVRFTSVRDSSFAPGTLRENVMISNLDTEREDGTLLETLKKADVDMESQFYPDGLETMLSREFDGVPC